MRITIEGLDSLDDLDLEAIRELAANALVDRLVSQLSDAQVKDIIRRAANKAAGNLISGALTGRVGDQPVTLIEAISAEARAQIHKGNSYQGVSTPLTQVIAAEVYRVMHDEVLGLITEARKVINQRIPQEISNLVAREMKGMTIR